MLPYFLAYIDGQNAALSGAPRSNNPYLDGFTKLGNPRFSDPENGADWDRGWLSKQPARQASAKEIAAAESINVQRFRKRR